jgi:thioredoxin reductase (NADPH)
MRRQAESFGAEFRLAEVTGFELSGDIKTVHTDKGDVETYGILLATGARPRMIGFPGEADYRGRGIAYCATCDGEFFRDKDVFVVGGGFAAAEESVFLTKYARHVTLLIREDDFTCAEATARPARSHPKITVHTNTEVVEVTGDNALKTIRYRNNVTGEEHTHTSPDGIGVFVFAGYEPATDLVKDMVELDNMGYIITNSSGLTSRTGIYAAGDVCVKNLRQVATAVGDGALAATALEKYVSTMHAKTGIQAPKPTARQLQEQPKQEKQEKKRNSWFEKHCKNCQEKCLLYKDKGKWLREITPGVYRKTLQWLLSKDAITLVMLQREMKMSYPLANSVLDTLILDGVITCQGPRIEKKVNHKKIRSALK